MTPVYADYITKRSHIQLRPLHGRRTLITLSAFTGGKSPTSTALLEWAWKMFGTTPRQYVQFSIHRIRSLVLG
jgi:hypothetical protein